MSWRLMLTAPFAPKQARAWYKAYVENYWVETPLMIGFREWPAGSGRRSDADSGPILMGVGGTATTFGLGAALALDDHDRAARLTRQLANLPQILKAIIVDDPRTGEQRIAGSIPYRDGYHTGFLYGDVTLFHAITPADWLAAARGR